MRASRRVRMLAGIALAAMSCSQLASAAHFLWVNHVRCAEHGELLHGAGEALHAVPAQSVELPSVAAGAHADQTSHEGDHCDVVARLQEHAISSAPVVSAIAIELTFAVSTLAERAATQPIALLASAPKSSPPALT